MILLTRCWKRVLYFAFRITPAAARHLEFQITPQQMQSIFVPVLKPANPTLKFSPRTTWTHSWIWKISWNSTLHTLVSLIFIPSFSTPLFKKSLYAVSAFGPQIVSLTRFAINGDYFGWECCFWIKIPFVLQTSKFSNQCRPLIKGMKATQLHPFCSPL